MMMDKRYDAPCRPDCPRRRASPTCHDPAYCPAWGEYAAKTERERQERRDQSREIGDYQAVRRKSRKWMQEMTRRKGLRER